jgi:hypothetical protein
MKLLQLLLDKISEKNTRDQSDIDKCAYVLEGLKGDGEWVLDLFLAAGPRQARISFIKET